MTTEKIAAAAIKIGEEVYTGLTHFAVMQKIIRQADPAKATQMLLDGIDGFITDQGRFVDRTEAFGIAARAKQMGGHEYADPAKNKAFYGTDKPSLDSGLIESWAELTCRPACLR